MTTFGDVHLDALAAFARDLLCADAEAMDTNGDRLAACYETFQARGLNTGWSPRQPLAPRAFCEALATLSRASGAFAFVALQQIVANGMAGDHFPQADPWPKLGVAFGHLRNPDGPAPVLTNGRASGPVAWLTGAGVFDKIVLGLRTPAGAVR